MMRVWTRRRKSKRSSRCSILARVQSRGQRRKTTPEMARERPKPKPCEKRLPPWLDDRADGFRRRDADGCDRDGRAPQASAKESGEANNLRLCSLMFAYVRLMGEKCLRPAFGGRKNAECRRIPGISRDGAGAQWRADGAAHRAYRGRGNGEGRRPD